MEFACIGSWSLPFDLLSVPQVSKNLKSISELNILINYAKVSDPALALP